MANSTPFSALVSNLDSLVSSTFGLSSLTVTFHFHDGSPDLTVSNPTVCNPAMEEDYVPGTPGPAQGVSVLILFLHLAVTVSPIPHNGDTATVNGIDYDVFNDNMDREGGVKLKLRRRGQRYDR